MVNSGTRSVCRRHRRWSAAPIATFTPPVPRLFATTNPLIDLEAKGCLALTHSRRRTA